MMALNIQPSKTQTLPKCGTSMWCEGLHAFVILEATCIMCWEGFGWKAKQITTPGLSGWGLDDGGWGMGDKGMGYGLWVNVPCP